MNRRIFVCIDCIRSGTARINSDVWKKSQCICIQICAFKYGCYIFASARVYKKLSGEDVYFPCRHLIYGVFCDVKHTRAVGRSEKSWWASSNVVGIICPLGCNRVNWTPKAHPLAASLHYVCGILFIYRKYLKLQFFNNLELITWLELIV